MEDNTQVYTQEGAGSNHGGSGQSMPLQNQLMMHRGQTAFNNSTADDEISLVAIFRILQNNILWIAGVGIVLAILVALGTKLFIAPTYRSYSTMYVYSNVESTGTITNSELQAAENLADTYVEILNSRNISKLALERTKATYSGAGDLTVGQFEDLVTIETSNGTQILKVTAVTEDPYLSAAIANAYAEIAPSEITRITKVGGVEIVDYAEANLNKVGPSTTRNTAIALILGAVVTAAFLVIKTLYDTTLYTKEDIEETTDIPVLSTVPEIASAEGKNEMWVAVEKEYLGNDN